MKIEDCRLKIEDGRFLKMEDGKIEERFWFES
jgi:hypothetical protein